MWSCGRAWQAPRPWLQQLVPMPSLQLPPIPLQRLGWYDPLRIPPTWPSWSCWRYGRAWRGLPGRAWVPPPGGRLRPRTGQLLWRAPCRLPRGACPREAQQTSIPQYSRQAAAGALAARVSAWAAGATAGQAWTLERAPAHPRAWIPVWRLRGQAPWRFRRRPRLACPPGLACWPGVRPGPRPGTIRAA
ncbi:hypothetical protein D3C87_1603660 [compost metagenome]